MKPWLVTKSETLVAKKWLTVKEQHIALPHGGEIADFHLLEAPDWSSVIAVTEMGQFVFVDQYRHGAGRVSRELPAGVIDAGETPEQAARRELEEETGFVAEHWEHLFTTHVEPHRLTSRAHFFVATGARRVAKQRVDPSENIDVVLLDAADIVPAIMNGAIVHGVHVGAIMLAARRGLVKL
ncbi:MAG: NUDIX hydrolase [Polyangiaceae bacterium]|nr:NUDIX hydrolase [Polyangiaceae bacterium]